MHTIDLLDQGYAWTAARIATITPDDLERPTPCDQWVLRALVEHTLGSLSMFVDTVTGAVAERRPPTPERWVRDVEELAAGSHAAWRAPGALDREYDLPMGTLPAATVAGANLLELVVHGWDVGQSTGEAAAIPDDLAVPILAFAHEAVVEGTRGDNFRAPLDLGGSPSDRLVSYLGRKPL